MAKRKYTEYMKYAYFTKAMESITLPSNKESHLVELSCDSTLKKKFTVVSVSHFW